MPSNTPPQYLLVSLPLSSLECANEENALSALSSIISAENGQVLPFALPNFKIGTLDTLVQLADTLAKLDTACENVVAKISDSLKSILDGDEEKVAQHKLANDKPIDQYIRSFTWNKVRYRADRPLGELVENLQKELVNIDADVKAKFAQYTGVKANLTSLQRKQTGNLSTKSLAPVVDPSLLVQDSEYLETHLIAVPTQTRKDFLKAYEQLAPMVVPRSAVQVATDDEFTLFAVTTFKKHSVEFLQKAREQRWTPRQYKYVEGGREEEQRELDRVAHDEKKVWGEALRLGRTGWSEAVMVWVHVMAVRVFVETVLRYGLPLNFVSALVATTLKLAKKVKTNLDASFSHLAGNAVTRDKKGRMRRDDATLHADMAAAGLDVGEGNGYNAYVYYHFVFP